MVAVELAAYWTVGGGRHSLWVLVMRSRHWPEWFGGWTPRLTGGLRLCRWPSGTKPPHYQSWDAERFPGPSRARPGNTSGTILPSSTTTVPPTSK